MLLSDNDIEKCLIAEKIRITGNYSIQPCSVDIEVKGPHYLFPGNFKLAETKNIISLPGFLAGQINGRSTYARQGLLVHCSSALIQPGFEGHLVLELKNLGQKIIEIKDGEMICTLTFIELRSLCKNKYNGKYQNQ